MQVCVHRVQCTGRERPQSLCMLLEMLDHNLCFQNFHETGRNLNVHPLGNEGLSYGTSI